jgi:hypothetical protein
MASRLVPLALLLVSGCHHAASDQSADHHVPFHKPADYGAAVARLHELHAELSGDRPERSAVLEGSELTDLIRWLPELAADSDLPEAPWIRVDHASGELGRLAAQLIRMPPSDRIAAYHALAEPWEGALDDLTRVAAMLGPGGVLLNQESSAGTPPDRAPEKYRLRKESASR